MQKNADTTRKEYLAKESELEGKLSDSQRTLAAAQQRIDIMKGGIDRDTPDIPNGSANVDGNVIGIPVDGKNVVYVDLGRKDHVPLGMRFQVYDPRRGVNILEDITGAVLGSGKATIEIIRIENNSSIGRVIDQKLGEPIQPGDLIANLVYDRKRTYKFLVFGDFEIDNDDISTQADLDWVTHKIRQWGGEVIDLDQRRESLTSISSQAVKEDIVPFDTDFVVVGAEPMIPDQPDATDAEGIKRYNDAQKQLEEFNNIQREAMKLGIPILNQNRFMALIGYTER